MYCSVARITESDGFKWIKSGKLCDSLNGLIMLIVEMVNEFNFSIESDIDCQNCESNSISMVQDRKIFEDIFTGFNAFSSGPTPPLVLYMVKKF